MTFEGINLFQYEMKNLVQILKEHDEFPEEDEVSFTFHDLGITLYSDSEEGDIQLISVFSKGYAEYMESIDLDALAEAIYGETALFQQEEDGELDSSENVN